jgi:hypothetical protein
MDMAKADNRDIFEKAMDDDHAPSMIVPAAIAGALLGYGGAKVLRRMKHKLSKGSRYWNRGGLEDVLVLGGGAAGVAAGSAGDIAVELGRRKSRRRK